MLGCFFQHLNKIMWELIIAGINEVVRCKWLDESNFHARDELIINGVNLMCHQLFELFWFLYCVHYFIQPLQFEFQVRISFLSMIWLLTRQSLLVFIFQYWEPVQVNLNYLFSLWTNQCYTLGCKSALHSFLQFVSEVKCSTQKYQTQVLFHRTVDPFQQVVK